MCEYCDNTTIRVQPLDKDALVIKVKTRNLTQRTYLKPLSVVSEEEGKEFVNKLGNQDCEIEYFDKNANENVTITYIHDKDQLVVYQAREAEDGDVKLKIKYSAFKDVITSVLKHR